MPSALVSTTRADSPMVPPMVGVRGVAVTYESGAPVKVKAPSVVHAGGGCQGGGGDGGGSGLGYGAHVPLALAW